MKIVGDNLKILIVMVLSLMGLDFLCEVFLLGQTSGRQMPLTLLYFLCLHKWSKNYRNLAGNSHTASRISRVKIDKKSQELEKKKKKLHLLSFSTPTNPHLTPKILQSTDAIDNIICKIVRFTLLLIQIDQN